MAQPKLRVRNLVKRYQVPPAPPLLALDRINFDVEDGDFLCLIGPSGCGKSTTLRIIAGFDAPTEGEVLLESVPVRHPGPDRAMVFQDLNQLFPWKTTFKNVVYPLQVNDLGQDEAERAEQARASLRLVGLEDRFDDTYPHHLSGGMKQRVAIARALVLEPKVLLMDEPFGSVDAQTRTLLQQEVYRIWKATRKTILFVTHNIEEAIILGNRILVYGSNPGRILEIFDNPIPEPRLPSDPHFGTFWERLYGLLGPAPARVGGRR